MAEDIASSRDSWWWQNVGPATGMAKASNYYEQPVTLEPDDPKQLRVVRFVDAPPDTTGFA